MRDYDSNFDTMSRDRSPRMHDRYDSGENDRSGLFGWNDDYQRGERRDYGPDQDRRGLARDETERLIASDKVEGTPVYGRDRDKLGSIHNFMVEKRSGKARYAVMKTSSGFLGLDERYFPIPWEQLTYDRRVDGYHIDMSEDDLERRRSFDSRGRPAEMRSTRDRFERSTW